MQTTGFEAVPLTWQPMIGTEAVTQTGRRFVTQPAFVKKVFHGMGTWLGSGGNDTIFKPLGQPRI
jgi:hypothetical protein